MSIVKINAIDVPEGAGPELERRFAARRASVEASPGFLGFELLRPVAGESRYFVYTRWETQSDFEAWAEGPARSSHGHGEADRPRPVASGSALLEFEVVDLDGVS
ncbi:monooxygenase [Flavimobilis marinus]|uniref:Heme-degrading monooxygenase HmoA n=1 Tax=Flavimobilis marinus TaxID=285351 RepID=A0A1I2G4Z5_9MICO|nr:antibiotic biosynthesis monooxygenase [Flavimobilis marinus]GHG50050.1 monooxygenase [Flavimobilis marinus]SFF12794.1 Heme-degrading monooxygenase HmoA [Flavimobilis marinus]